MSGGRRRKMRKMRKRATSMRRDHEAENHKGPCSLEHSNNGCPCLPPVYYEISICFVPMSHSTQSVSIQCSRFRSLESPSLRNNTRRHRASFQRRKAAGSPTQL